MQKVLQKQESMQDMFHRRQASLKKLAAKQTRPVQPVAPRPEALTKSPGPSPGTESPLAPSPHLPGVGQQCGWAQGTLGLSCTVPLSLSVARWGHSSGRVGCFGQLQVAPKLGGSRVIPPDPGLSPT